MKTNLSESKYNRLTIIKEIKPKKYRVSGRSVRRVLCTCVCGKTTAVVLDSLRAGKTKSCGCLQVEKAITWASKLNKSHGLTGEPIYNTWRAMKARCYNKNSPDYSRYGGRGITICKEWLESFEKFYKDMGGRPKKKTLDRINNNGNYCKENCRWATAKEQANNRVR